MQQHGPVFEFSYGEGTSEEDGIKEWQNVLNDYLSPLCDSFGVNRIVESDQFLTDEMDFFRSWHFRPIDLAEQPGRHGILMRFELNESCLKGMQNFDFGWHRWQENGEEEVAEFDSWHFFSGEDLIACYTHHHTSIEFFNRQCFNANKYRLSPQVLKDVKYI